MLKKRFFFLTTTEVQMWCSVSPSASVAVIKSLSFQGFGKLNKRSLTSFQQGSH